ncbi:MAG: MATE family efflux transporter [Ignavibacterium sp.]|nr:MATE family efflux transporter [Ignavibacterium sp.]MDW8376291.1 MATE family efflux transporter [Ignavibacteriales bacterium]
MNLSRKKLFYSRILKVALPAIAGLSTQMIVSLVDAAMVGRLENATYALAAMGIGVLATWALISFFSSLATGTHVIVARRFGQQNFIECGNVLNNSLLISIIIGTIVTSVGVFFSYEIANLFSSDNNVTILASDYIFYRFLGIPLFLISVSYRGFYFGINKGKAFMVSGVITNLLNVVFNYLFIFGNLGFPRMELAGAGLGSTLATSFDFLFYTYILLLKRYRIKYQNFKHLKIDFEVIRSIVKISLPVSFQNLFILIGFLSFIGITGIIGTKEQAASQAIISTMFISFLPCFGFGIAVQTLVGINLGANKYSLARIYGFETAKVASIYTIFLAILFLLIPEYMLLIITNDNSIIQTAKDSLRIAGVAQMFYALGIVLANALQAAGKIVFVMKTEVITNLFIFVPLAYVFGIHLGLGLNGAWLALPIYIFIYSLSMLLKFSSNDWYEKIPLKKY